MVVLGVRERIMMLQIRRLSTSVLLPSARCIKHACMPTTIIGTNSTVNLEREVKDDTILGNIA